MKKTILVSALLLGAFIACKKSNSTTAPQPNGISADVNGKSVTFNFNITADTTGGSISIEGYKDTTSSPDGLWILINGGPVKAGVTYTNYTTINASATYWMNHLGTPSPFVSYNSTVTVTAISSTNIEGTFQGTGTHFSQNSLGNTIVDSTIQVTNGKFNIKF